MAGGKLPPRQKNDWTNVFGIACIISNERI
jgi:hypothetical protein